MSAPPTSVAMSARVPPATAARPKPPIAEKPAVPSKPTFIPPPMRTPRPAADAKQSTHCGQLEHRRLPSTGLRGVQLPASSAVSPPQIRAAGTNGSGSGGSAPSVSVAAATAAPTSHIMYQRGRTPSTASQSDGTSDYDRTSYQLEAIKQKSLDLDRRWPAAHYNDEQYGVFSRSASDDKSATGATAPAGGAGAGRGGAGGASGNGSGGGASAARTYQQQNHQHHRVPNKIFQQSSKQLEQILAQRIEKEAGMQRKGGGGGGGGGGVLAGGLRRTSMSGTAAPDAGNGAGAGLGGSDSGAKKPMDMAKLLNAEMKLHCKSIQEKHLIERRMPQQAYSAADGGHSGEQPMSASWFEPGSGVKFNSKNSSSMDSSHVGAHIWTNAASAEKLPAPLKHELLGHMRKGSSVSTRTVDMDELVSNSTSASASTSAGHAAQGADAGSLDDKTLIYRDGVLISGSLDALIQHMVPTDDYRPDKQYTFAFLLSARLFLRPHQLLERICAISDAQRPATAAADVTNQSPLPPPPPPPPPPPFAANFVRLLCQWVDDFPYDFRDERLMQHVRRMTQKCTQLDAAGCRRPVSQMLQMLLQRLTTLDNYELYLNRVNSGASHSSSAEAGTNGSSSASAGGNHYSAANHLPQQHSTSSSSGAGASASSSSAATLALGSLDSGGPQLVVDITELCSGGPAQLAHQLTHIELERLSHIGAEEFVQAFAKENLISAAAASADGQAPMATVKTEAEEAEIKKTRNLESYVQWFNRLSYLVASEIVKYTKKKQRVRIIEYWIETARESFNIGNFNSLMAIIAGLNMSPISRLKKTWAKVQSAKFMVLEHQMDPTSNFHSYRSTLKAAMWRSAGATDERQRIVIPFFSLLVKDLYFLNEGCSNRLANGYINFEKFWQLAKQVHEFIGWKQVQCTFDRISAITWQLQTGTILSENELAWWSFECEPPDSPAEKDRFKSLKAELQLQQHQQQQQQH